THTHTHTHTHPHTQHIPTPILSLPHRLQSCVLAHWKVCINMSQCGELLGFRVCESVFWVHYDSSVLWHTYICVRCV
ncbi:hypothetical protein ANANG_G00054500, partial [Anguilla anguilla]